MSNLNLGKFSISESSKSFYLILILTLPIVITIFSLTGGNSLYLSRILTIVLILLLIVFILNSIIVILKQSAKYGFLISGIYIVFLQLLFRNYTPVMFGGQDPGYYSAFSKILARGLGSPFPNNSFEQDHSFEPNTLWSIYTDKGFTEIQFYPMLPSLMSGIDSLTGDYTYPAIAGLSGLVVSTFILKFFCDVTLGSRIALVSIWLFMPATLWFSRTPSSEIISVVFVAFILTLNPSKQTNLKQTLLVFLLTLNLVLVRPNPIFIVLLLVYGAFSHQVGNDFFRKNTIFTSAIGLSLGVTAGIVLYWQYMPNFGSVILSLIYYPFIQPSLILFTFILVIFTILYAKRNYFFSETLKSIPNNKSLNNIKTLNSALLVLAISLVFIASAITLRNKGWGDYESSWFGENFGFIELVTKTPVAFFLTTFGLTFLFVKSNSETYQTKLLLVICAFTLFALLRNPAIPMTYFYERYWWSEIALFLVFLIGTSISGIKKNSIFIFGTIFSVITLLVFFGWTVTSQTEGGASTKTEFEKILTTVDKIPDHVVFFKDDEAPSWVSQFVIPLRYYYGLQVSSESQRNRLPADVFRFVEISSQPCGPIVLAKFDFVVGRLSKYVPDGNSSWQQGLATVYLCSESI